MLSETSKATPAELRETSDAADLGVGVVFLFNAPFLSPLFFLVVFFRSIHFPLHFLFLFGLLAFFLFCCFFCCFSFLFSILATGQRPNPNIRSVRTYFGTHNVPFVCVCTPSASGSRTVRLGPAGSKTAAAAASRLFFFFRSSIFLGFLRVVWPFGFSSSTEPSLGSTLPNLT